MKKNVPIRWKNDFVEIKLKPFVNKRNKQLSVAIPKRFLTSCPKHVILKFPKNIFKGTGGKCKIFKNK